MLILFCDFGELHVLFLNIEQVFNSGPEVIKLFSCSTQLSMEFQMLASIKISRNSAFLRLS